MADSMSPVTGSGSAHRIRVMVGTQGVVLPTVHLVKKPWKAKPSSFVKLCH